MPDPDPGTDGAGDKLAKKLKEIEQRLADAEADRDKWKDLSRKHEERSKTNADAADELKKLRESRQTEEEKLATKLADLEKRANEADVRALRAEVAQVKGLTPAQAKRLQGSSKEELETDADDLLESFPAAKDDSKGDGAGVVRKPKENLRGGNAPEEEPEETDPRKLAAQHPRY